MYKLTAKGMRHEKPFYGMFHFMAVFMKSNDGWQEIASQNTRIEKV